MVMRRSQRGIMYLVLLFAVAATSATLAGTAALWSRVQQREREAQLLWAGDQIRRAIVAYARHSADEALRYPQALQDLLLDPRSAAPRRYLRRVYDDPMSGGADWALIRNAQGRIVGVHSRSAQAPLRRAGFPAPLRGFEQAERYSDWRFSAVAEPAPRATAMPQQRQLVAPGQGPESHPCSALPLDNRSGVVCPEKGQ
jgi:hypothetical protein